MQKPALLGAPAIMIFYPKAGPFFAWNLPLSWPEACRATLVSKAQDLFLWGEIPPESY